MVNEWCKDGHEDKDNIGNFDYAIDLPNPYDIGGPWITVKTGSLEELTEFAMHTFGADNGNIQIISILPEGE